MQVPGASRAPGESGEHGEYGQGRLRSKNSGSPTLRAAISSIWACSSGGSSLRSPSRASTSGWSRPPWCRPRPRGPPSRCPRSRDETRPTPLSPGPSARGLAPGRYLSPAPPGQRRRHQDRPQVIPRKHSSSAGGRVGQSRRPSGGAGKSEPIRPPPQRWSGCRGRSGSRPPIRPLVGYMLN